MTRDSELETTKGVVMKYFLTLCLLIISSSAFADNAEHCLQFGTTEKGQSITNICDREIAVIWCHNANKKMYIDGLCGRNDKFYQKNTALMPQGTSDNYYSLPPNAQITFGACFGGHGSYKYTNKVGGYSCPVKKANKRN